MFCEKSQIKKVYSMGEKFLRFRMFKDLYIYNFLRKEIKQVFVLLSMPIIIQLNNSYASIFFLIIH